VAAWQVWAKQGCKQLKPSRSAYLVALISKSNHDYPAVNYFTQ
jgi:hypothetical protein